MYYLLILILILIIIMIVLLAVHIGFRAPRIIERNSPADYGIAYKEIRITTVANKQLFAWWLPTNKPAPTLIILHGWGGNAELMLPLALPMHRAGLNILLLDARNHGRSDSDSFSSLPRFAEDTGAAINWIKKHGGDPNMRIALLGHSVGASALLLEASRRDDIAALISIAAFAHPEWMMRRYLNRLWMPSFCKTFILRYVEWVIGFRYTKIAPINVVNQVQCPILLVHGTADEVVPLTDAQAIQEHYHGKKLELLLIEGGEHESIEKIKSYEDQLLSFLKKSNLFE